MMHFQSDDIKSFLLNFFAVVLGIAITFGCDAIVSAKKEKAEVRSSLNLVKNELKDNVSYVMAGDTALLNYAKAARFLIRYEGRYQEAPADSLNMLCNYPLTIMKVETDEDALDLLKTSSIFTKIKDQELSLDIIRAYGLIEERVIVLKMVFDMVNSSREAAMTPSVNKSVACDNLTAEILWTAITSEDPGRQFLRELQRMDIYADSSKMQKGIDDIVARIEAYND